MISIIVPIYNAERYICRCIDSILSQKHKDLELLLIDDGSTDSSGRICDEYASKDSRIRVFHKENGGVSSARNLGLDNVRGEWVAFVDADDEVVEGYLNVSKRFESADVIQKPYIMTKGDDEEKKYTQGNLILRKREDIFRYFVQKRTNALWDKLIKTELIGNKRFAPNISIGEDFLFFLDLLPQVRMWTFDNTGAYRHYIREGSAMQSVDFIRRKEILWENILNVQKLTEASDLLALQKSIVYKTYVMYLYGYRHKLNTEEVKKLKSLFGKMRFEDLRYVDFITMIKLFFCKFRMILISK